MSRLRTFHFGEVPATSQPVTELPGFLGPLYPVAQDFAFTAPENIDAASRSPRLRTAFGEFFLQSFHAYNVEPVDPGPVHRATAVVAIGRMVGRSPQIREFMQACDNSLLHPFEFSAVFGDTTWNCRRATCTSVGCQVEAGGIMIVESLQFTLQESVLTMAE